MRRNHFRLALAAAALTLTLPVVAAERLPVQGDKVKDDMESQVTFRNDSSWAINELYFSRSAANTWGRDQLGHKTVRTGDAFTLNEIPCGTYDVKLVDEEGDQCDIDRVQLCAESHTWSIRDKDLARCQAHTRQ